MSPVLKTGDTATIEPVAIDDLVMRDIIVFWSDDKLICHVVWAHSTMRSASGERMIVTRGLASLHFDYPVRESEIIGRVKSHRIGALAFLWYQILNKFRLKR
ncbi:MAG TPA: hypothetical protein VM432_12305 [Bdellovibrionales bacterium]|nr:hypothetical protein [Bdellovibrionales bacterium]